jgi:hypothetical protein
VRGAVLPADRPASRYEPDTRIICGKHWRLGDARPRGVYSRAMRKLAQDRDPRRRAADRQWRCWERVLKQAIERSAGVSA